MKRVKEDIPLEEWEIFRPLYGASFSSSEMLELGCYKIYSIAKYQEHVQAIPNSDSLLDISSPDPKNHLVISIRVDAHDSAKAKVLADIKFHQFDNIIRYMLGNSHCFWDVAVFNYIGTYLLKNACLSSTGWESNHTIDGVVDIVELDGNFPVPFEEMDQERFKDYKFQQFFKNPHLGHEWIWNTLSKPKPTDLQGRLISAIEWTGKSLRDSDKSRAFVQLVFALESLFTFKEKGVLVSPGIASQISEFSAFILGSDYESRTQTEEAVKDIYAKRSGIVHGGNKHISEQDFREALSLVKKLISKMTTDPTLRDIPTSKDLNNWVKKQKYSYGEK